jgi:S1-C subfamily serine protease
LQYLILALPLIAIVISAADQRSPYQKAVIVAVMIESEDGQGSGVFVLDGRYILTAAHVVEGKSKILAHSPADGGYGPGMGLRRDEIQSLHRPRLAPRRGERQSGGDG